MKIQMESKFEAGDVFAGAGDGGRRATQAGESGEQVTAGGGQRAAAEKKRRGKRASVLLVEDMVIRWRRRGQPEIEVY